MMYEYSLEEIEFEEGYSKAEGVEHIHIHTF